MKHRCLLIGFGNIARIHAKYLNRNNIEWDWYDPFVDDTSASNRILALTPELFDYRGYTRVFILTPESLHYRHYKMVRELYDGWLFIEKPVAIESLHVKEILADDKVVVGLVERFNPAIETLVAAIDIDKLINIDFSRCCVANNSSDIATLTDIGIHDIDLFCYLTDTDHHVEFHRESRGSTVILTLTQPHVARFIWSKDTYFKERKIIVRQSDCTLVADLQEQSVMKYYNYGDRTTMDCLYVEKSSPIENQHRNFLSDKPHQTKGRRSHAILMELIDR